jgi:glutathione S-transferase
VADLAPETGLAPPAGTFARYRLQSWLELIAMELEARFEPLFEPDTPELVQQRVRARLGERFNYIGGVLQDRPYLMGGAFTVADAYLYAVLRWCERFELDLDLWPNVEQYFVHVGERPSVEAALAAEGLPGHRPQPSGLHRPDAHVTH